MGKRQTTQFTTELWNFTQTDFGQGQSTSGRLLGEMMREEETHGRPWVRQELDSSHGAMQRNAFLSPQSTAQVSRLRDYTRNSAATSTPLCAPSARKQEWNYFSMWPHTKSTYTSLLTTQQQRHGIADFRMVPLTIDWAFPCQSIKTTPPLPTPYMSTGYPALAKPSGDFPREILGRAKVAEQHSCFPFTCPHLHFSEASLFLLFGPLTFSSWLKLFLSSLSPPSGLSCFINIVGIPKPTFEFSLFLLAAFSIRLLS